MQFTLLRRGFVFSEVCRRGSRGLGGYSVWGVMGRAKIEKHPSLFSLFLSSPMLCLSPFIPMFRFCQQS